MSVCITVKNSQSSPVLYVMISYCAILFSITFFSNIFRVLTKI